MARQLSVIRTYAGYKVEGWKRLRTENGKIMLQVEGLKVVEYHFKLSTFLLLK